ncbi:DUF2264 domain-containing protein [Pedobacter sp. HMF7647]|uniref:DUF2264 domain-containing protein n=2 Tax=Hufsiella arboris TaxID=2695275 RepID=A0A7K1Y6N9_9SPHI|nr:DUF2264 domain-containing protein [Hufsiella arboris]
MFCFPAAAQKKDNVRKVWLQYLDKVARPVMENLADNRLKIEMPVKLSENVDNADSRKKVAYLEAFGRTFSGIAPWLESDGGDKDEVKLRNLYRDWTLKAIANAVNPNAKDYLEWKGGQPLVDASFLALGLVRAPWVWNHLDKKIQQQLIDAFKLTRNTVPVYSNWILFSGMIEAFFAKYDISYDPVRVEFAVREFTQHWYIGDGMYSDGMSFHLDYYNSIVIQPYLSEILEIFDKKYSREAEKQAKIGQRYSQILERMINTDGSYPALGRSIAYRSGVFHHLANEALKKRLPETLSPAQVRGALTAVMKKTLGAPQTFDDKGWLIAGLYGNQPGLADFYITTGSLYLACDIFLPLGLSESDGFWSGDDDAWTSVKIWSGKDVKADHALDLTH